MEKNDITDKQHATILISHDSQDEKIAREIKSFLERIFLSEDFYVSGRDLEGGQTWVEQIKHRLKSSKAIIALLTRRSINSHWVYFESGAGFIEDRTIPKTSRSFFDAYNNTIQKLRIRIRRV